MSGKENYVKHSVNEQNIFSFCGNNRLDNNEFCDDGNLADGDGCNSYCQGETSGSNGPLIAIVLLLVAAVSIAGFVVFFKRGREEMGVKTEGGETDKEMMSKNKV